MNSQVVSKRGRPDSPAGEDEDTNRQDRQDETEQKEQNVAWWKRGGRRA